MRCALCAVQIFPNLVLSNRAGLPSSTRRTEMPKRLWSAKRGNEASKSWCLLKYLNTRWSPLCRPSDKCIYTPCSSPAPGCGRMVSFFALLERSTKIQISHTTNIVATIAAMVMPAILASRELAKKLAAPPIFPAPPPPLRGKSVLRVIAILDSGQLVESYYQYESAYLELSNLSCQIL
jgi:hypothetical protein